MFLRRGKSLCQRLVLHCNLEAGVPITETGSSWIQEHCGKTIRYINQISRSKWATQRDAPDRDRSYGSRMFSGAEAGKETQVDDIYCVQTFMRLYLHYNVLSNNTPAPD